MTSRTARPARTGQFHTRPLTTALLLALALPAAAETAADAAGQPQSDTTTFDPVEVTGERVERASSPKFTAPLLDTPQTLSVVPSDVFNAQGAQNLTDVLRNTPGISFNAGENGFSTNTNNFSLRGFDTSGSIFIDGVRDSGNYARDVFNVDRVEVAKGPAADNGRGGLAGYVNMVSKTPQLGYFARGTASFGADGTDADSRLRATVDLNNQLGEHSALRLNLMATNGGVPGREHASNDAVGIAPSLAFGLGTDTRFILAAEHVSQSGRPDWGVPGAFIPGTINHNADAERASTDNFYGLASDFDENTSSSVSARFEHDFSPALTLSNFTRWSQTSRDAVYTVPTNYVPATQLVTTQAQAFRRDNDGIANLTNLTARFRTGGWAHTLSTGLDLSREESESDRFPTPNQPSTSVFAPDFRRATLRRIAPTQSSRVRIDSVAAYAYDTIEFGERWQLTGGLRAERYEVSIDSRTIAGAPQGPDGYEVSDTTVSGKLGLVYKPAENGSLYASVNMAALPPGNFLSNPDISRDGNNAFPGLVGQNNEAAKTQRAVSHELGVKWDFFDDKLSTSAALFNTTRRSVAITGREPGVASSPEVLRGYGQQVVRGLELSATGSITEAWTVFAGAVFLDSERKLDAYLDAARCTAAPTDYRANATVADCAAIIAAGEGVAGDELAFTPRRSASLWTTYAFGNGLTVGGGLQYVGNSWAGRPDDADRLIPNGRWGKLPGYTVGNLMASYAFSDRFSLRLNIDNVTDETYATSGNWAMSRVFLGPPRNYLLSADFRFW
ncbi:TonB-dependent receptor [Pseudoxanthomonas suwonensis]|uniref:Ligand-gated channel protein n=1 Tax=Pseudoxanthomonas suwonensis TaxID=314722 RepID=A0A0E3UMC6_9GAMM|nr:TonB-dependent receptor [Pseudoxanthomonas suwonensis]AKC86221.1 ligand-gated channel protein [Pseudoxanthomonas suwonensis]